MLRIVAAGLCSLAFVGHLANAGPLHDAARDGNLQEVKKLIAAGEDVNKRNRLLGLPLHQAAANGNIEITKELIDAGADVNVMHRTFGSPLHTAALKGNTEIALSLLAHGANVDVRQQDGSTPLHLAAAAGDAELIEALVSAGADVNARMTRAAEFAGDYLATHAAAANGHLEIVALLRSLGAQELKVEPITGFLRNADIEAGREAFFASGSENGCQLCHSLVAGDGNPIRGPNLAGIIYRPKVSDSGYDYSDALLRLGGFWSLAELNGFIAAPLDYAPGSRMDILGIRDPQKRANIISFLISEFQ